MDICSFINSRDVAAYCREINKIFTTFEMAIIIGRSNRPITEKHASLRELIANYPDMPTPKNMHYDSYDSLHKKLAEVIEYEEHMLAIFKTPEQGTVYRYHVWQDDEWYSGSVFPNFETAFADMRESCERSKASKFAIGKMLVGGGAEICVDLDYDGTPYEFSVSGVKAFDIWACNMEFDFAMQWEGLFHIDIPTPFKRGDILTYGRCGSKAACYKEREFVLERMPHGVDENYAWGYFVCDDGLLSEDHMYDYDSFEYYRGKLEGNQRLLQYVSWYLKDEIALTPLLLMQCRIMLQHQFENGLYISDWAFQEEHMIAEGQVDHEKLSEGKAYQDEHCN